MVDTSASGQLAQALRQAVRAQDFALAADGWQGGLPVGHHPSIDLAVVAFPPPAAAARGAAPAWANVLFSREHPQGVVADLSPPAHGPAPPARGLAPRHVRLLADCRDARLDSLPWLPGADWSRLALQPLQPPHPAAPIPADAPRFVQPYPASLLKLLVAVGAGLAVDRGACTWQDVLPALDPMITVSSNEATDELVARLHRAGVLAPDAQDPLHRELQARGLHRLRLAHTTPAGGWRNADGAGVGRIHMTAWDTVRLLWLLDADAPPPPWLAPGMPPLLQPATCDALRAVLARQQLDEVLSSGRLRGLPGWVPGLPDAPRFAHKTGTTDNYASDAGIVAADAAGRGHLLVAVLTSLGRRFAPQPGCATTWRLPALGASVASAADALW
jgi:hypothetical protein